MLELAVVLVVIGVIIGAVMVGGDVQRSAAHQRVINDFVQGWQIAYENYRATVGVVPGDDPTAPTGSVGTTALCGAALRGAMQARGIAMPEGRATGSEDRAIYLDHRGVPRELAVCFQTVGWAEPGATVGSFVVRNRNVMVLTGLTPSLATTFDQQTDGRIDARAGRVRESTQAANTSGTAAEWSRDETAGSGGSSAANPLDEAQSVAVTGYLRMAG